MKNVLTYILAAAVIILLIKLKIDNSYYNKVSLEYNKELLLNQSFKRTVDSLNRELVYQEAIIIDNVSEAATLIDSVYNLNIRLKNLQSFVKQSSKTQISNTFIKYDTIVSTNNIYDTLYIKCANYNDAWVSIDICDKDSGLLINDICFNDTSNIIISKSGFLKPKYNVQLINSNPYKSTTELKSIVVNEPKYSKLKNYILVGLGLATGLILAF